MRILSFFLAMLALAAPLTAQAQESPAQTQQIQAARLKAFKAHFSDFLTKASLEERQTRADMLDVLTPSQHRAIGQLIAQFIMSNAPDYYATVTTIDGMLAPAQRHRILAIEQENMRRSFGTVNGMLNGKLPNPEPGKMEALLSQEKAGGWLLQTLLTDAMGADPAVINRGINALRGGAAIPR